MPKSRKKKGNNGEKKLANAKLLRLCTEKTVYSLSLLSSLNHRPLGEKMENCSLSLKEGSWLIMTKPQKLSVIKLLNLLKKLAC